MKRNLSNHTPFHGNRGAVPIPKLIPGPGLFSRIRAVRPSPAATTTATPDSGGATSEPHPGAHSTTILMSHGTPMTFPTQPIRASTIPLDDDK